MNSDFLDERRMVGDTFVASLVPRHATPAADIILVPGSCHGWWAWRFWAPALAAAGYATHALSMPNHTDAAVLPEAEFLALTPSDYAARVAAVAATLPGRSAQDVPGRSAQNVPGRSAAGIPGRSAADIPGRSAAGRPLVLAGHSLGGIVAQIAAKMLRPAALIPVASTGADEIGGSRPQADPMRPMLPTREEAARMWFADVEPEVLDWAMGLMTGESPATRNAARGPGVIARGDITCPVLVIGAGRDGSTVPPQPALAEWLGGECVMFPTAGHDIMLERQALPAVRKVIAWLDRTLPA